MGKISFGFLLVVALTSCSGLKIPLFSGTPVIEPSPYPQIISPTPPFIPTNTLTGTQPTGTANMETPTLTASTVPTSVESLGLEILGCNTSLDITHGLGEVTNAFPVVRNQGKTDLTNVCATLSASDEAKAHPDKTACTITLPPGYQIVLKLTVDTGFKQDTSITVNVTTEQGFGANATRSSCREVGLPGSVPAKVGILEPIP